MEEKSHIKGRAAYITMRKTAKKRERETTRMCTMIIWASSSCRAHSGPLLLAAHAHYWATLAIIILNSFSLLLLRLRRLFRILYTRSDSSALYRVVASSCLICSEWSPDINMDGNGVKAWCGWGTEVWGVLSIGVSCGLMFWERWALDVKGWGEV